MKNLVFCLHDTFKISFCFLQIDLRHPGHAHLVPVVDQRLDTWPPDSRSPANVRSAAQQIAQWQQQQQQQAQQQQQLAGIGATPAQWQQARSWLGFASLRSCASKLPSRSCCRALRKVSGGSRLLRGGARMMAEL